MKIIKSRIFAFILGAVIFSGITGVTAYTMLASDVGFTPKNNSWKVDNVSDAIDDLYSKSKPAYTGTTTVTPTTSTQTLSTKDKLLKDNITINPIPSSYKNLTTTTDVNPSNLLNGIKAYNSNGELVTGTLSIDNCVSGTWNHTANTNWNYSFSFVPSTFSIYHTKSTGSDFVYYKSGAYNNKVIFFSFDSNNENNLIDKTSFTLSGKTITSTGTSKYYSEAFTIHYVACK